MADRSSTAPGENETTNDAFLAWAQNHLRTSTYAQPLNLDAVEVEPGRAVLNMKVQDQHMQIMGVVQGGILAVLADTAFFHALRPMLKSDEATTTIEIKLNYLSPAKLGDTLIGVGTIVQRGNRIAVGDMEIYEEQSKRLVLKGLGTYMIFKQG